MRYLIYARVSPKGSTWAGTETTIPDQVAECRGYLLARDPAAEIATVTDEFASAASARRPGYQRILAELEGGAELPAAPPVPPPPSRPRKLRQRIVAVPEGVTDLDVERARRAGRRRGIVAP